MSQKQAECVISIASLSAFQQLSGHETHVHPAMHVGALKLVGISMPSGGTSELTIIVMSVKPFKCEGSRRLKPGDFVEAQSDEDTPNFPFPLTQDVSSSICILFSKKYAGLSKLCRM